MEADTAGRFLRPFLLSFTLICVFGGLWSLATPLDGGPDERVQIMKAAAVVRGQWVGEPARGQPRGFTQVRVPEIYARLGTGDCVIGRPAVPAGSCPAVPVSTRVVTGYTYVGHYPPLYYLLVGWPSVFGTRWSLYLMRLAGLVVNSVFLAAAVATVAAWSRSRLLYASLAVATTPMVFFMASVINPNGLEISAAIAMWTAGVVWLGDHPARPPTGLVAVEAAAICAELLVRGDSPIWVICWAAVLAPLAAGRVQIRGLTERRDVRVAGGCVGLAGVAAVAWLVAGRPYTVVAIGAAAPGTPTSALIRSIAGGSGALYHEVVGKFGWLDTPAPSLTYFIWTGAAGALVLLAVLVGRRRALASLGLAVGVSLAVPFVLLLATIRHESLMQGRYYLPLVVAVPIVAGGSDVAARVPRRATHRGVGSIVVLAGVGQVAAAYWALRRYLVGAGGPLLPWASPPGVWHPPLPAWLLDLGFVLVWAAMAVVALGGLREKRRRVPDRGRGPASETLAERVGFEPTVP